ncbi:MAG TPA: STAS/SEC14 domain-containing protein [Pseudomonadales bacterium]
MQCSDRVTYRLDRSKGFIETRCVGPVNLPDVMEHFARLEADADLPEQLDVLLDLTEMTSVPEAGQLRQVADAVGRLAAAVRLRAIAVVASRDVLFGMSRVFEAFIDERLERVRVFRAADDARRWLACPEALAIGPEAGIFSPKAL